MSEAKHTPGPWGYGWDSTPGLTGHRCSPTVYIPSEVIQVPIFTGNKPVAWVLSSLPDERAEADARLIASAPELLEALKVAREEILWWEKEHSCCRGFSDKELAQIDAAIAKATGEQA